MTDTETGTKKVKKVYCVTLPDGEIVKQNSVRDFGHAIVRFVTEAGETEG